MPYDEDVYSKAINRLNKEKNKIYNKIPKKYKPLLNRAIEIEYKLCKVEEGSYTVLDDELTKKELKELE